ncbi:MAG: sulfatase-like hydrolase/transferase, partial [Planctomycetales bacterium]
SIQAPAASVKKYGGHISEEEYEHQRYLKHPQPRAGYAAMISHMDQGVGQIMELVKQLGLDEDTLIMFSSDNGPAWPRFGGTDSTFFNSTAGLRGYKGSLYEGGIRVPLLARWPGHIQPNEVSDHLGAFWDILPTIADLAGCKISQQLDGIRFSPTLLGNSEDQAEHDYLYWEFAGYSGQQAVRMGPWKAMRKNILLRGNTRPMKIELFHLNRDRSEQTDVAAENPQIVDRMRTIMKQARTRSDLFPIAPLDNQ